MKIILSVLFASFILCACSQTQYVYVSPDIPKTDEPPAFVDYNISSATINNKYYYIIDEQNTKIMLENWIKFREWANKNYEVLKKIERK